MDSPAMANPDVIADRRFGWAAAAFGAWIIGGFVLVLWALRHGATHDAAASPYHVPVYLGVAALGIFLVVRATRNRRRGLGWGNPVPVGYGLLGIGFLALIAVIILDLGWREGVGMPAGIESDLGLPRALLGVALVLVAAAPLSAALGRAGADVPRAAVLISASLVLGILAWPGGFHPAVNPWPERAPLPAGANPELWVMNADGSRQTRLVRSTGDDAAGYASWSPSADMMAYTRFTLPGGDYAGATGAIWVAKADGGSARALTPNDLLRWIPRFSPDGRWVAYTREAPGGPWGDAGPVGPGQGVQQDVSGPLNSPLPHADIYRIRADGSGTEERLTHGEGDSRAPVYSPDGTTILFDTTRDGNTELYVMNTDGSDPRRLTNDPGEDWGASWSPDGTMIAFNSDRTGFMEIYVMDADGSNVRQITHDEQLDATPSWSPDGTRLAFVQRGDTQSTISTIDLEGVQREDLSQLPSGNDVLWTGGWGADGRILFSRQLPGPAALDSMVRENLGVASLLLTSAGLAAVLMLLSRTSPSFGAFTVVLGLGTLLAAVPVEAWQFVPAGLGLGFAVDVAVWMVPTSLRPRVAGSVGGAGVVLTTGAVALVTAGLGWTPSLLLGVAAAGGAIGWAMGAIGSWPQIQEPRTGA